MEDTPSAVVRMVSSSTVKPPPRPRHRIPLTSWDVAMLSTDYIQKGLLFHNKPAFHVVEHLAAALTDALADYYPVAGRFVTDHHRDELGNIVGCSVSIDCDGQGVDIVHAVAHGVSVADVIPPEPTCRGSLSRSSRSTAPSGSTATIFRCSSSRSPTSPTVSSSASSATTRWPTAPPCGISSTPGPRSRAPVVLACGDLSELIERPEPPSLRTRVLHFSAESLAALKERARQELLAAGDTAGAAALTRFQALSSLAWRCITRARRRRSAPEQETTCRAAINNRARLRPALPAEYFGNSIDAVSTETPVRATMLLEVGAHGWAAAAVGRAVAAHDDGAIRARVAAWMAKPVVYTMRWYDPHGTMVGSSPRFDMYGCDFGWGRPVAVRSGKANKVDGRVSLNPGREGGGTMDAEVSLTPEQMTELEQDDEFWAAVSTGAAGGKL